MRQNWGTSTIMLYQELLLPEGQYALSADVWKSGLGGNAYVSVQTQDGPTTSAPLLENMEQWQSVEFDFESLHIRHFPFLKDVFIMFETFSMLF